MKAKSAQAESKFHHISIKSGLLFLQKRKRQIERLRDREYKTMRRKTITVNKRHLKLRDHTNKDVSVNKLDSFNKLQHIYSNI